jgi:hypothetical protein
MPAGAVRRFLKRAGLRPRFDDFVRAEHVRAICIGTDGRAKVTVQEKLVFLDLPEPGDLHDICAVDPQTTFENFIVQSSDSAETGRRRRGRDTFEINWEPRSKIIRYAVYEHEYSWFPLGSHLQPALFTEFQCTARTGHFLCELITPQAFEAAVVFERPRWPLLNTERRLVKYALRQLEAGAERPGIRDNGQRIEWRIAEPRVGKGYVCVAFHQNGMLLWGEQLKRRTLAGQMRRLVSRFAPG